MQRRYSRDRCREGWPEHSLRLLRSTFNPRCLRAVGLSLGAGMCSRCHAPVENSPGITPSSHVIPSFSSVDTIFPRSASVRRVRSSFLLSKNTAEVTEAVTWPMLSRSHICAATVRRSRMNRERRTDVIAVTHIRRSWNIWEDLDGDVLTGLRA